MMRNRRAGFTLVEIVVALGLMSTVMVMVTTAFLLLTNYSAGESGFFETLTDLTNAQNAVTRYLNERDSADRSVTLEQGAFLCAFDAAGDVSVGGFSDGGVRVSFSGMEAWNTNLCELTWDDADGAQQNYNFDVLAWAQQPWVADKERAICGKVTAPSRFSVDADGSLSIYSGDSETPDFVLQGDSSAAFYEDDGEVFCRLTNTDASTVTPTYSFRVSLPPEVLRLRCEVLAFAARHAKDGIQFGIADAVLCVKRGEEKEYLCYVSGESSATYVTGFLRRDELRRNLLLRSGEPPLEIASVTGVELKTKSGLGVLCRLSHWMRGQEQSYDFLTACHAAGLPANETEI